MTISGSHSVLLLLIFCIASTFNQLVLVAAADAKVSFINVSDEPIKLHALMNDSTRSLLQDLAPYKEAAISTTLGDTFVYQYKGEEHSIVVEKENQVILIGPDSIKVECSTSTGPLHAVIKPYWSPRGAARFLNLVDVGYYNGCALNRVVKAFLCQFGIGADFDQRTSFRSNTILDDVSQQIPFQPGYMSYAGSGANSRSTEVFIVMSDTSQRQLDFFGTNPWETAFGYVEQDTMDTVDKWEASYGDMAPWGNGPDPQEIYQKDGYEYLKQNFPNLSYLQECKIVKAQPSEEKEEEL